MLLFLIEMILCHIQLILSGKFKCQRITPTSLVKSKKHEVITMASVHINKVTNGFVVSTSSGIDKIFFALEDAIEYAKEILSND